MHLSPIETVYNGYRFRSRLEARWAVFFDAIDVRYEYEPNAFDLGSFGFYLPDFWLPEISMWFEVKGPRPTKDELNKLIALSQITDSSGMVVYNPPGEERFIITNGWKDVLNETYTDNYPVWCDLFDHRDNGVLHSSHATCPIIQSGYIEARSARFDPATRNVVRGPR